MNRVLALVLVFLSAAASAQQIPQLPAASTPLSGSEIVPIVQGGVTKQANVAAIAGTATLPTTAGNSLLGNSTVSATTAFDVPLPSCAGQLNALTWTSGGGFGCNLFSGAGFGNVVGPPTSVVGYIPTWGNTLGTLLSAGIPAGTAASVNTGTSGATVPLNNGGFTQSGLANFTGGVQINGTAVTLPVPIAIGGTGQATAWQARNALCPLRSIPSGTSDTATTADCVVVWNSATASAKAQAIPACTSGNGGFDITIVDGKGSASGVIPITVTPASGTVLLGASAPINANFGWLHVRCDGGATNYVEIG